MLGEQVVFKYQVDGGEPIDYIFKHMAVQNARGCHSCDRHTLKVFKRYKTTASIYITCQICYHQESKEDKYVVTRDPIQEYNKKSFKCPARKCSIHQSFKDFVLGRCCKDAVRKINYELRREMCNSQRDYQKEVEEEIKIEKKIEEAEINLRKRKHEDDEAKQVLKNATNEAERTEKALRTAEEEIMMLKTSLSSIQKKVDAKQQTLDAAVTCAVPKIITFQQKKKQSEKANQLSISLKQESSE